MSKTDPILLQLWDKNPQHIKAEDRESSDHYVWVDKGSEAEAAYREKGFASWEEWDGPRGSEIDYSYLKCSLGWTLSAIWENIKSRVFRKKEMSNEG